MRTGEWVVAENWRLCSTTLVVRGVAGELADEKWRLGITTLVRRVAWFVCLEQLPARPLIFSFGSGQEAVSSRRARVFS